MAHHPLIPSALAPLGLALGVLLLFSIGAPRQALGAEAPGRLNAIGLERIAPTWQGLERDHPLPGAMPSGSGISLWGVGENESEERDSEERPSLWQQGPLEQTRFAIGTTIGLVGLFPLLVLLGGTVGYAGTLIPSAVLQGPLIIGMLLGVFGIGMAGHAAQGFRRRAREVVGSTGPGRDHVREEVRLLKGAIALVTIVTLFMTMASTAGRGVYALLALPFAGPVLIPAGILAGQSIARLRRQTRAGRHLGYEEARQLHHATVGLLLQGVAAQLVAVGLLLFPRFHWLGTTIMGGAAFLLSTPAAIASGVLANAPEGEQSLWSAFHHPGLIHDGTPASPGPTVSFRGTF